MDPQPDTSSERTDLSLADLIDELCDVFEQRWIAGQQPRFEELLSEVDSEHQPQLLRELIGIEIVYRAQRGEQPSAAEYESRVPGAGVLFNAVYQESRRPTARQLEATLDGITPLAKTKVLENSEDRHSFAEGRYTVLRTLGAGGQKQVYLAHDRELDRDVVIAVLHADAFDTAALKMMRREAKAMARLDDHPHVVSVYGLGEQDGQPYMVAQYIQGGAVEELIPKEPETLPIEQTLRIAEQVCQALEHTHKHGVVHRDVKPANIWLTRDGTAMLGDFGLAKPLRRSTSKRTHGAAGTVAYMAPEQIAGNATASSDLYSLGVMLYEMVTGRKPFSGGKIMDVIDMHLSVEPDAPSRWKPDIDSGLETLILQLLAKSPQDRPSSASHVRETLLDLISQLQLERERETGKPDYRGAIFGRRDEMHQLRAGVEDAITGHGLVFLIAGEPGSGKSRLLEELAAYAARRDIRVLQGTCHAEEHSRHFTPWLEILSSLRDDERAEGILDNVESLSAEAAEGDDGQRPMSDMEAAHFRTFDEISTFLCDQSKRRPILIAIDDLHWADEPSLELFLFLSTRMRDASLAMIGTHWDVFMGRRHGLTRMLGDLARERLSQRIAVGPLGKEDVEEMITAQLNSRPEVSLTEAFWQLAEGNAFYVTELAKGLHGNKQSEKAAGRASAMAIPATVREAIGRHLNLVSDDCRDTLRLAAAVGRAFTLETVEHMSRLPGDEVVDLLEEAVAAGLIRELTGGVNVEYSFARELIRRVLREECST